MLGFLLAFTTEFFHETSSTLAKRMLGAHAYSYHGFAMLNAVGALLFLSGYAFFANSAVVFLWTLAPFFALRALLEVAQVEFTLRALEVADRSTFAILRTLTLPLLLLVDLSLGTALSTPTIIGIVLITVAIMAASTDGKFDKRGAWYVILSALNAVILISLFKYNISHGNSVTAEQGLMLIFTVVFFGFRSGFARTERRAGIIFHPKFLIQTGAYGVAVVLSSFAYLYAPASVITAVMRSSSLFWSIVAGASMFHEKGLAHKTAVGAVLVVGLFFLRG